MKKVLSMALFILLFVAYLEGAYIGNTYFRPRNGTKDERFMPPKSANLSSFFAGEIVKGNLRQLRIQKDYVASMEHHRYQQFFKELEVFGAQIIQHYRNGKMTGINGMYFQIPDMDTIPVITHDEAAEFFKYDLDKEGLLERREKSKLLIYPVNEKDYRLAYEIVLEKGIGYSMTGIIDAKTGEVLLKYSNINYDELTIGLGIGYHGEQYKLSTTYYNGFYYLYDENGIRPVNQYTIDWSLGGYIIPGDHDNYWDYDGALINAHAFLGLIYDYYYLVHLREGIDDYNLDITANIHLPLQTDNAFWSSSTLQMYFCDPYYSNNQYAAGLDCVAHEYSHGVTQFTSDLIYSFESGALNESFSDVMGTAVEYYWQPEGSGLLQADWYIGEDATPFFSTGIRNLADPNSVSHPVFGPHPCHLWQKYNLPNTEGGDWGGVHQNSTIYSHAYYLLALGGTNSVSGITVSGIGIDKATNIFYRTWTYYLWPSSEFIDAATYLLYSAYDLYGSSSNEYAQTKRAMEAIGWIYGSQQGENSRYRQPENSRFFKKDNHNIKDIVNENSRESGRLKIASRAAENGLPQIKSDEILGTVKWPEKKANKKEKK